MEALLLEQQKSSKQEDDEDLFDGIEITDKDVVATSDGEEENQEEEKKIILNQNRMMVEKDADEVSDEGIEKHESDDESVHVLDMDTADNNDNDADAQNNDESDKKEEEIEPALLFIQKKGPLPKYLQRLHKNHPLASSKNLSIVYPDLNTAPIHELYPTTLLFLLLLHFIFFHQWNHRHSKKDVQASYRQIVRQKKFYKIPLALLSHPPPASTALSSSTTSRSNHSRGQNGSTSSNNTAIPFGSADHDSTSPLTTIMTARCRVFLTNRFTRYCTPYLPTIILTFIQYLYNRVWIRFVYPTFISPFLKNGSLSGLPLLTYISHLLWECRALEEVLNSVPLMIANTDEDGPLSPESHLDESSIITTTGETTGSNNAICYLRTIITLALLSLSLELYTYHMLFKTTSSLSTPHIFASGASIQLDDFGRPQTVNAHRIILDRGICTLTSTISAIVFVYQSYFPHAPFNILPFVSSVYINDAGFSCMMCLTILMCLSSRVIDISTMSILYGMSSAGLWVLGVTSWLSLDDYWGNGMLCVVLFCIALSLRAGSGGATASSVTMRRRRGQLGDFIPCIDYVSWDERGRVRRVAHGARMESNDDNDSDEDSGDEQNEDVSTRRRRQYRDGRNNSNEGSHVGDTNDSGGGLQQASTSLTSTPGLARRTVSSGSGTSFSNENGDEQQQQQSSSSPHVLHHRGRVPLMSMDSELDGSTSTNAAGSSSFMNDIGRSPSSGGASDGNTFHRSGAAASSSSPFRSRRD